MAPNTNIRRTNHDRIGSAGGEKKEIWSTLLNNVASGKKIPEKRLLVLGGSQESQREFIDSLATQQPQEQNTRSRRQDPRANNKNKKPGLANQFALGYTYRDILDVEGEGKPF